MAMDSVRDPKPIFSCSHEFASLAVSSDLLHHSWDTISELRARKVSSPENLWYSESHAGNYRIIAFVASAVPEGSDLVPLSETPDFKFLCSKSNPEFSISRVAKALFDRPRADLAFLKDQAVDVAKDIPYLITGHGLGGLVASLFTLWLLDALDLTTTKRPLSIDTLSPTTTKRPLCITFGSPLLGDLQFQQAISRYSAWNSCFLHTVHRDDPYPGIFPTMTYRPFGTFLFLSESGKACFEAPELISKLLERMKHERNGNHQLQEFDYGPTLARLRGDATELSWIGNDLYEAAVIAQLIAIGLLQNENDQAGIDWVKKNIVEPEKAAIDKGETFEPVKKLSEVKVNMAQLEWYKKTSENDSSTYYDCYKTKWLSRDQTAEKFKKILTDYWEKKVEEVEKKPQKEEAHFRKRWLYGGTNFRRMVEPLDIAKHYKKVQEGNATVDRKCYWSGRSNCYTKLEEWLKEDEKPEVSLVRRKQTIKWSLTEDSCFWARVEEALISCKAYINGDEGSLKSLLEFESYVFGLIKRYAVSPEIFLPKSSYMMWWKEYDHILSSLSTEWGKDSELVQFMRGRRYHQYTEGNYP